VALLQTTGFNNLIKAKHGYTIYNKNDRYIGRSIEAYGEFSEKEVALFRQICKVGFVVVEVGANIGSHTLALSKMVGNSGRVYAFEPQRVVFQTLCGNLALNSIENVEAFDVALSDEDGSLLIPDIRYDVEGNFGGVEIDKFKSGRKTPKAKLDNFLELQRLDFLKIDVEGMEREVLLGALASIEKFKPIMYIENDRVDKSQALIALIKDKGYNIYEHNPMLFNPNNFAKNSKNIFNNIVSKNILCVHKSFNIKIENFKAI